MSSGKGDFYFSLTLSLFCAAVFCMSFSFPPEAAIFPKIFSAVLFVLSAYLLYTSIRRPGDAADAARPTVSSFKGPALLVLGFAAYGLLVGFMGYMATTIALVYYTIFVAGYRRQKWMILTSVVSVVMTYFIFGMLLGVPLPDSFITRMIQG